MTFLDLRHTSLPCVRFQRVAAGSVARTPGPSTVPDAQPVAGAVAAAGHRPPAAGPAASAPGRQPPPHSHGLSLPAAVSGTACPLESHRWTSAVPEPSCPGGLWPGLRGPAAFLLFRGCALSPPTRRHPPFLVLLTVLPSTPGSACPPPSPPPIAQRGGSVPPGVDGCHCKPRGSRHSRTRRCLAVLHLVPHPLLSQSWAALRPLSLSSGLSTSPCLAPNR